MNLPHAGSLLRTSLLCLAALTATAHAAIGDDSFNPEPDIFALDKNAYFEGFTMLGQIVGNSSTPAGLHKGNQDFESGFLAQQEINDWFAIGTNRMRAGFGSSLNGINWNSRIGSIDASATEYGLTHPHGTYGNAPGITAPARNYIADLQFLTHATASHASPPTLMVLQFETPVTFLSFSMIDYAGGSLDFSLWQGSSLGNLTQVRNTGRLNWDPSAEIPAGEFNYLLGGAPVNRQPDGSYQRESFNYAILQLGTEDVTIGFDNFYVVTVTEPENYAMFLTGLGLFSALGRKRLSSAMTQSERHS